MTKGWTLGCHRARTPEETLLAIEPWLLRCGITRVADVTGLDSLGIPTVMVVRPNGRSLSVTQGKGLSIEAAKVSGIMEAIEHDHAEAPDVPVLLGRLGSLSGRTCDVARLPSFPRWHGLLTGDTRLLWANAEVLGHGGSRLVPFEMVHLDLTLPLPEGSGFFPLSSNGLASGNTLLEATLHALYELVERDARSLFFLSSQQKRDALRVNPQTVDEASCRGLLARLAAAGLRVGVWDITTDVNIAAFLVGILDSDDNPFHRSPLAYGSGAHLDRHVALVRAITEAAQTRLTNIVGARDDTLPEFLTRARSAERQQAYRAELQSAPDPTRAFDAVPHTVYASFEEDLELALRRLQECGIAEVLRVDLSRPGWPVHVVRLIIPGLEGHIDMPEYRPGPRAARIGAEP